MGHCTVQNGDEIAELLAPLLPHPDLRGGRSYPFAHKFSPRQMVALSAICDTIIPSVDSNNEEENDQVREKFFRSSAVEIVPEVAAMLCSWTTRYQFILLYLALLLLLTPLGTLLIAGLLSLTLEFPFFHRFSELSLSRREAILRSWSRSPILVLQMLFKVVKCYTQYRFYSRADVNGKNPVWDAIGYCVPATEKQNEQEQREDQDEHKEQQSVLSARIISAKSSRNLHSRLASLGCTMLDDVNDLSKLDHRKYNSGTPTDADVGIECDVVVIGSGSGGGVVAARLASMGHRVVVVEKGSYFAPHGLSLLEGPSMMAMYEQSGALCTAEGAVILLTGTTLGGGSAINWAAAFPTPTEVVERWASLGLPRFSGAESEYVRAMSAVCERLGVQDKCTVESFQNAALRMGCAAMGYPVGYIPRNAGEDHHCGFCSFGCPHPSSSRKQSGQDTWLYDAAAAGAVVITDCSADVILGRERRPSRRPRRAAAGVVCRLEGGGSLYIAARACVAACGSLRTPPLLRRSGLRNWHIGRHLSLHPVAAAWGYFPPDVAPPGTSYEGGIMTTFSKVAGGTCLLETPSLHPGAFATLSPWISGRDSKQRMLKYSRTATVIVINRDHGRGTVREEYNGKLLIEYRLRDSDRTNLVQGTEAALRALHAAGADSLGTNCIEGEVFDQTSKDEFEEYLRRVASRMFKGLSTPLMSAHQMGSCRMGSSARTSAVDPNCQSWEMEGLFVADASVFPSSSGVNPMITVQANAYCTADAIANFLDML